MSVQLTFIVLIIILILFIVTLERPFYDLVHSFNSEIESSLYHVPFVFIVI